MATLDSARHPEAPGPRRPGVLRRIAEWWGPRPLLQLAVILAVAAFAGLTIANITASMARIGISPGFAFLSRSAGFEIGEAAIAFQAGDTYLRAIAVGLINTVQVAALGCVLATVLGVSLGVAGLSGNLLLGRLVQGYVEVVRNTPLLLQLFFWISLAQALPAPRQALSAFDLVLLSNRGVHVPGFLLEDTSPATWLAAAVILAGWWLLLRTLRRRQRLGVGRGALLTLGALAMLVAVVPLTGGTARAEIPALAGFNIRGGFRMSPEFAALLTALTVKFSASIAEIVRAGIQSVSQAQREAARALGLSEGRIMRLVVLPQALRVVIPLVTSIYLDLTKDSSLAVAIGYPDLVSILNTTANTTGQAIEALIIMVAVFLVLNLGVSWLMNRYNRRVALRGGRPA